MIFKLIALLPLSIKDVALKTQKIHLYSPLRTLNLLLTISRFIHSVVANVCYLLAYQ